MPALALLLQCQRSAAVALFVSTVMMTAATGGLLHNHFGLKSGSAVMNVRCAHFPDIPRGNANTARNS